MKDGRPRSSPASLRCSDSPWSRMDARCPLASRDQAHASDECQPFMTPKANEHQSTEQSLTSHTRIVTMTLDRDWRLMEDRLQMVAYRRCERTRLCQPRKHCGATKKSIPCFEVQVTRSGDEIPESSFASQK
ncbi:hypothetical protein MRX96_007089 [Rhipicephalus microplus]